MKTKILSLAILISLMACNDSSSSIEGSTSTELGVEENLIGKWVEANEGDYLDTLWIWEDSLHFGYEGKSGLFDGPFGDFYAAKGKIGQENGMTMFEYDLDSDTLWLEFTSLEDIDGTVPRKAQRTTPYVQISKNPND